jgi:hypothetical protein
MVLRRARGVPALLAALALASCGGGGGTDTKPANLAVARPSDFPSARSKTLNKLQRAPGPMLAASVSDLKPGVNRFGFGLFDRARRQISGAPAAIYVQSANGGPVRGPFLARDESLSVEPEFQSETVRRDPDAAQSVYVADVRFPRPGNYNVLGVARLDGRLVAATSADPSVVVLKRDPVPDVGEKAPRIDTPTVKSAGSIAKIDTRVPHDDMHDVNFADVLGKRPAILLFATPQLCQSRVCGPVVDIAEQVKHEHPDQAAFIHMEIYNDNDVQKGYRPQFLAYHLPSEPWLFAVNAKGRVAARIEGAFSLGELEAALKAATRG